MGETDGRQGHPIWRRRPRQDAARRRRSRQCGEGNARAERPQCRARQVVRRPPHHQGRRHRRQGDRARRQVREHGRPDGARSGLKVGQSGRRRHHDRHTAGPGHRARRRQVSGRRHEPDGSETRHRPRGRSRRCGPREELQEGHLERGNRPGRHHFGQRRR